MRLWDFREVGRLKGEQGATHKATINRQMRDVSKDDDEVRSLIKSMSRSNGNCLCLDFDFTSPKS